MAKIQKKEDQRLLFPALILKNFFEDYFLPRLSSDTVSFFLPLALRAASTLRPLAVDILSLNPCLCLRLVFEGWYVLFISLQFYICDFFGRQKYTFFFFNSPLLKKYFQIFFSCCKTLIFKIIQMSNTCRIEKMSSDSVLPSCSFGHRRPRNLHFPSKNIIAHRLFPIPAPSSLLPVPCSQFPVHCSLFPVPCSLFTVHCSLITDHYSLITIH